MRRKLLHATGATTSSNLAPLEKRAGERGMLTKELLWLTLTGVLTGLLWAPYILDRIMVRGLMGAMANPSRNDPPQSPWAQRLYFAHTNAVENLVVFAVLVLVLDTMGISTPAAKQSVRS